MNAAFMSYEEANDPVSAVTAALAGEPAARLAG